MALKAFHAAPQSPAFAKHAGPVMLKALRGLSGTVASSAFVTLVRNAIIVSNAVWHSATVTRFTANPPMVIVLRAIAYLVLSSTPAPFPARQYFDSSAVTIASVRSAVSSGLRARAVRLLDYLERADDLIPDGTPVIGHLDDALLVELAWPAFEDALGDYEDFRRYSASARRGTKATP